MKKIRLLIADDHPAFIEGLARLLNDEDDLDCIAKAADGLEAIKMAEEYQPDVVILDVSMPKVNGIEAAKEIKKTCPKVAILMISAFDYQSYILASLQAGAVGYMSKDTPLNDLVGAIRLVYNGGSVLDAKATSKIVNHLTRRDNGSGTDAGNLLPRELEVLKLAANGMSNKKIARELIISERTVQTHLVNIFRKLEVNSRTQAVLKGLEKGWLNLDNLSWKE